MSTTIDQKAYLQKYISSSTGEKKKKKKKVVKGKGFKIIDDDIDLTKLRPLDGDELDILGEGEDAPQIAGIIDERPEEIRKLEQFKTSSKWRVINQDDGFNSKIQIEEVKRDIKEVEKENEIIFGKMYSDSEDETKKDDSDPSPPRKQSRNDSKNTGKTRKDSDSDVSPPRKRDLSPKSSTSKQRRQDSDTSPPRKNRDSPKRPQKKDYDSDLSPPRKGRNDVNKKSKERKKSRWGDFEETESRRSRSNSPRRKMDKRSDSPRRSKRKSPDSDVSPPRKSQKKNYDSDVSSPRKSRKKQQSRKDGKRNRSPDSDISPPRKRKSSPSNHKKQTSNRQTERSRNNSDSDLSPPRKRSSKHSLQRNKRSQESDSDLSPPRKETNREKDRNRRSSDSPPPSNKKMAKTLEGKMAGLQNAAQLREENEEFRRKQDEAFKRMGDEVSGRNAQVVSRRSKRENSEERRKQQEKAERQKELDEKYKKWSKGLKQLEDQQARVQDFIHEASKPLARHRGDKDLEDRLKDLEREGDPMLKYMREKKRERGEFAPERPTYKGNFPPNRFNIRPGYRWDGADRSNGYESKYFDQQSKRKAQEEEAYKWSTEDL